VKISNKKISFFSTRNQYFPHIPYVASKKSKEIRFSKEKPQTVFFNSLKLNNQNLKFQLSRRTFTFVFYIF
jgi:hypothetical protein